MPTRVALRSAVNLMALKGPLVSAPSEPAPVVEGDFPVRLLTNSMKSSGSSWKWMGLKTARGRIGVPSARVSGGLFLRPGRTPCTGKCTGSPAGTRRRSRAATSATRRSRAREKSVRTCRYRGLAVGLPLTMRKWLELTTYLPLPSVTAAVRRRFIGSVKSSNATTCFVTASACSVVSASKLDMKLPSPAMSSSHFVSQPRTIASSGRWKSRNSQFRNIFTAGLVISGFRCWSFLFGTTMEVVMSSSVWIFAAGTKSNRSWNFLAIPVGVSPMRRYCVTTGLPSMWTLCPSVPSTICAVMWDFQSLPQACW
mmetsp:Transcript_45472/g.141279  ORF Transcript_45472/g.141279 Transcript_45472/m.141279 type:complete len:311 (-) Transcript_45472:1792-2724(-)